MVHVVKEGTGEISPRRRFEFWRDTALANVAAAPGPVCSAQDDFAASRWIARTPHGTILRTTSEGVTIRRQPFHIGRDGADMACIQTFLSGTGWQEQAGRVATRPPGSITFADLARPLAAATPDAYEEIRLYLPRASFQAQVGSLEALAGASFAAGNPLVDLLVGYLRVSAEAFPRMTDAEAKVMFEGTLHLLRGVVQVSQERPAGGDASQESVRAVADAYIERRLHDASLDVREMLQALHVSRSRLYAAYAESGGVQTAIRDARLDRAHRQLSAARAGSTVLSVALACGFADHSSFGHAFRRRFGLTPRDVLAGRRAVPA